MNPVRIATCICASLILACAATADAQVINPRVVEFDVSADHSRVVLGQPAVTRYELRVFAEGASAPITTADLGKPTPASGTRVSLDQAAVFAAVPLGAYVARVAAIGPGGEGVSDATSPFGRLSAPSAPSTVAVAR